MTDSNDRKNIIKRLVIIIILGLGAGVFLLVMLDSNIWKAIILLKMDKEIKDARIHLVGKVTDMNNLELEDVTLDLDFGRPKDLNSAEHITETRTINGGFTIEKSHYTSVSISFDKPGYRTEHITFYTSEAANTPKSAIQENCHIKLREIGTLAALVKEHADLEYDELRRILTVFDLSEIADGNLNKKELKLGETIPLEKYLRLDFERDDQGEIILEKPNFYEEVPKTFYLRFVSSDPDDGLVLAGTNGRDKADITDITWLTQAPEGEYAAKELKIPFEDRDTQYFFYIKCGKNYGKGVIITPKFNTAGNRIYIYSSLFVRLYINKNQNDLNVNSY